MAERSDPNAISIMKERSAAVRAAQGPLIRDRSAWLCDRIAGLDILDVGCVNHSATTSVHEDWLHGRLARQARSCLGVDILPADVEALAQQGYNVKTCDVTREPLPEQFDAIVCGELVEHVGHVAGLFTHCRQMLRPGGKLLLSTPNPWFINYILKALLSRQPIIDNVDHVAWYEPCVFVELATRHGFRLSEFHGIQVTHTNTWKAGLLFRMLPVWRMLGLRQELFAKSILYEFHPVSAAS